MSGFAYTARQAAGTDSLTPSGWPFGWQYPGDVNNTGYPTAELSGGNIPGLPWPPAWPIAVAANTALVINVPATISRTTHTALCECYLTVNGDSAAASIYANHLIRVICTEATVTRQLRKSGGAAYVDAIYYKVTNYQGIPSRWGFNQTIDFDNSQMSVLDTFNLDGLLVTAIANPDGTDTFTIIS